MTTHTKFWNLIVILKLGIEGLLQVSEVIQLEMSVELDTAYEVLASYSSEYWHGLQFVALIRHIEKISDEAVVFKADCYKLLISTNIEAERHSIVVLSTKGERHLQALEVEEPHVIVITSSYQEQDLVGFGLLTARSRLITNRRFKLESIGKVQVDLLFVATEEHLVLTLLLELLQKLLLCLLLSLQIGGVLSVNELDALHIVDLVAVESDAELWVDRLVFLLVEGQSVVVLLVIQVIHPGFLVDQPVEVVVLIVDEYSAILLSITPLDLFLFSVRRLEVKLIDKTLHLGDHLSFGEALVPLFGLMIRIRLDCRLLIVLLAGVFVQLVVNVDAAILKGYAEFGHLGQVHQLLRVVVDFAVLDHGHLESDRNDDRLDPSDDVRSLGLAVWLVRVVVTQDDAFGD